MTDRGKRTLYPLIDPGNQSAARACITGDCREDQCAVSPMA